MRQISVVLADEHSDRRRRLARALRSHEALNLYGEARELTEAFSLTEDHAPEVIVVPQSMIERPEFVMMDGLLQALRVKVICLAKPSLSLPVGYRKVNPEVDGDRLCREMVCLMPDTPHQSRPNHWMSTSFDPTRFIVVGASTGGIDALIEVLTEFPPDCPPTLIVQHTGGSYTSSLVRLLQQHTRAQVREASNGEILGPGDVRLAPGDTQHLEVVQNQPLQIARRSAAPISGHLPSIDALFQSASRAGSQAVGVLLTGMGRDGAAGLKMIRDQGGHTIAQDNSTSLIYGMPRAAMALGAVIDELPISKIGGAALAACMHAAG